MLHANNSATILVVDDYDDTRRLIRIWLGRKGYRVIEADNGLTAIATAQREVPDLILMDIEMPELDGLSTARCIHEDEQLMGVPIIAVSAYSAEQYREKALEAGCTEYVTTPFSPDKLSELIAHLLSRS